jgi:hypothetical protein
MLRSCRNRDWDATIAYGRQLRSSTFRRHPSAGTMVLRALCHTGRMPYELLSFPVDPAAMAPDPRPRPVDRSGELDQAEVAEMYLDLGLLNFAELVAYNSLDRTDLPARACQVLVITYVLKGNPAAAKPLLGLLGKSVVHREWAERWSAWLGGARDERIDAWIAELRANAIVGDEPGDVPTLVALRMDGWSWETVCEKLLAVNGHNRMAFEYMVADHLLSNRPDRVVETLPRLREFGYPGIPVLYQEAILMDYCRTGRFAQGVDPAAIDPGVTSAYEEMMAAYRDHDHDPAATLEAIRDRYGRTYFAYYMRSLINAQAAE